MFGEEKGCGILLPGADCEQGLVAAQRLRLLERAMERFKLSARAYGRILKISRTIADLEGAEDISLAHLSEAIGYRSLDRGMP